MNLERIPIPSDRDALYSAVREPGWIKSIDAALTGMLRILGVLLCCALSLPARAQERPGLIPPGWTQAVADPETRTRKFVSPDGRASLTARQVSADRTAPSRGLDRIAYRDDEQVTYHRRAPSWVAVSGYRDGNIFYRKINLACHGTRWNFVELEYPRDIKRQMDATVTHIAHGMTFYSGDCGR